MANDDTPSLKDLATVLVQPRPTMRRVLEKKHRWAAELTVLAYISKAFGDSDIRVMPRVLPGLTLTSQLTIVAFGLLVGACVWVLGLYAFGWVATQIGRQLEGRGTFADVRAALGWGLVPIIWAVIFRIPIVIYRSRLPISGTDPAHLIVDFISQGGCTFAIVVLVFQLVIGGALLTVASLCVAEAHQFSGWKGLATLMISALIPFVIVIAAMFAFRT